MTAAAAIPHGAGPLRLARLRLGLVALLVGVAALCWWWTARRMSGMDDGPWTSLGALGWFASVWVVMMAAMMFPSVAPTVALYSLMAKSRSLGRPLVFTSGYLVAWTGVGVLALAPESTASGRRRFAGHVQWQSSAQRATTSAAPGCAAAST